MSATRKDYYKILGVTKDADEKTIKSTYKLLAVKWHPDKNPNNLVEAECKFKEISEAYEVLSDANKKKAYDDAGKDNGFSHCTFFSGFNDEPKFDDHDPTKGADGYMFTVLTLYGVKSRIEKKFSFESRYRQEILDDLATCLQQDVLPIFLEDLKWLKTYTYDNPWGAMFPSYDLADKFVRKQGYWGSLMFIIKKHADIQVSDIRWVQRGQKFEKRVILENSAYRDRNDELEIQTSRQLVKKN